ncbi:thioesterase II family protein [Massilia endophytica]|uniref:thioesterase II family protein n=1 Tax=Massilia endophytica TaxID=2899220 RepID=UPI001E60384F|nr:alpha/beta fold hydrolase [Massilia endophytica]UGQ48163.1 alpha/beta fold hydrolase [Massilia endophytica]
MPPPDSASTLPGSRWLVRRAEGMPAFRLFCFHHAGGNASAFEGWQHALPGVEVCALQLPGRGMRFNEAPLRELAEAARALAGPVTQAAPALPFAFFGHSMGALLAFELARFLAREGLPQPVRLIASGCEAPRLRSRTRRLHRLDDAELIASLRRFGGAPEELLGNRELMELLLPTIRADFELAETYGYVEAPRLGMPIDVLAGRGDTHVAAGNLAGWQEESCAGGATHWFDGGHFFITSARREVTAAVAELLRPNLPCAA